MILTTHRGHGHLIAKGVDLNRMMAELFAKETGCCRGRGGSMHIMSPEHGIIGANGIVGAGIVLAPGVALACRMQGRKDVIMVFFGDGASNQGTFHEGINLASVWKLHVVFVCENNLYAESTLQADDGSGRAYATNIEKLSVRAAGYGIPGVTVDGNDVEAVYEAASAAVERARAGGGPTLLECRTYKWFGHYIGDPALYRGEEEVDAWKKRDPIPAYEKVLLREKVFTRAELTQIERDIDGELDAAVAFAKGSPDPDPDDALRHNYV
jgi:TPP-dependent pyruvate/acetoin dehydrogenase alpha subunit